MNAIQATWINGHIVPDEAVNLPEGCKLIVEPVLLEGEKIGLTEAEWRDDPEAIAAWSAWLKTIEPLEFTDEEVAANEKFEAEFRKFNIEAVRQQMEREDEP
jgi:hypothetical protein